MSEEKAAAPSLPQNFDFVKKMHGNDRYFLEIVNAKPPETEAIAQMCSDPVFAGDIAYCFVLLRAHKDLWTSENRQAIVAVYERRDRKDFPPLLRRRPDALLTLLKNIALFEPDLFSHLEAVREHWFELACLMEKLNDFHILNKENLEILLLFQGPHFVEDLLEIDKRLYHAYDNSDDSDNESEEEFDPQKVFNQWYRYRLNDQLLVAGLDHLPRDVLLNVVAPFLDKNAPASSAKKIENKQEEDEEESEGENISEPKQESIQESKKDNEDSDDEEDRETWEKGVSAIRDRVEGLSPSTSRSSTASRSVFSSRSVFLSPPSPSSSPSSPSSPSPKPTPSDEESSE